MFDQNDNNNKRERSTKETESWYKDFVDHATDLVQSVDSEGRFIYVNQAWFSTLKYTAEEVKNITLFDIIHPDSMEHCKAVYKDVLSGQGHRKVEAVFVAKDGTPVMVEGNVNVKLDENGHFVQTRGIFRNITERKRAEEELLALKIFNESIIQNIQEGIIISDLNGMVTFANPALLKELGYSADEFIGTHWTFIVPHQYHALIEASDARRLEGKVDRYELLLKHKKGVLLPFQVSGSPYYNHASGDFDGTMAVLTNINARKQAEEELKLSEERAKKQRAAITELVLDESIVKVETAAALNKIAAVTAKALDVERSSIWILDESGEELRCLSLYEAKTGTISSGAVLQAKIIPRYFAAIKEESRIYAENAQEDLRTSELTENYLKPLGIVSMLDAGIIVDGVIRGVICLEHVDTPRLWQADEEAFASTVSSIVAQLFIADERTNLLETLKQSEAKYRLLTENVTDVVWTVDHSGKLTYVSPAIEKLLGYTSEEIIGTSMSEYLIGEDYDVLVARITKGLQKKPAERSPSALIQACLKNMDNTQIFVEFHTSWIIDQEDNIIGVQGSTRDITKRKQVEDALKESEQKHREILAAIEEGYYEVDLTGSLVFFNESFCRLTGLSSDKLLGKNYKHFYKYPEVVFKTFNQVYQTGISVTAADWLAVDIDGREAYMELSVSLRLDENGNPIGFRGIARDITKRRQTEEKIRYLSFHDQLTGLHNRHFLEEEMKRLDTERQLPISIIMADLNGLKLVNDTYGHQIGDEMLKRSAKILKTVFRDDDLIARFGGDEFVLYLPRTSEAEARKISARIERACHKEKVNDVPLSLSTGVAVKVSAEQQLTNLLKAAEDNLYQNKLTESRSGKSAIVNTLLQTLAAKSFETEVHTRNMQEAALRIGEQLGLPDSELRRLNLLITLHDIGKINIPEELLNKKEALTASEWVIMKKHSETGYRIARATDDFAHVADDILTHHERWDGSGYPRGLKGDKIPLLARITAIADAYEVMNYGRPYKQALSRSEIVAEFKNCSGTHFDPELVKIFLTLLEADL